MVLLETPFRSHIKDTASLVVDKVSIFFAAGTCCSRDNSTSQLGSLHRTHLVGPAWRRLWSSHDSDFVGRNTRDTNVVLAFEHNLNVAEFQAARATKFRKFAGGRHKFIDKVIRDSKKDLPKLVENKSTERLGKRLGNILLRLPGQAAHLDLDHKPLEPAHSASSWTVLFRPRSTPKQNRGER